jgi:beta-alanine--pyruvate transaminase
LAADALSASHGTPDEFSEMADTAATPDVAVRLCAHASDAVRIAIDTVFAWHEEQDTAGDGRNIVLTDVLADDGLQFAMRSPSRHASGLLGLARLPQPRLVEDKFVKGQPADGARLAEAFRQTIAVLGPTRIAAVMIEPLGMSHGILVPPHGYLEAIRELCSDAGIALIFDERRCALGRTCAAFAAQLFGVAPDLIVAGDVLTNGTLPLGAVLAGAAFAHALRRAGGGHPVHTWPAAGTMSDTPSAASVAAAHAMLDICEHDGLFARAAAQSPRFLHDIFALADLPVVSDIRGYGLLAGLAIDARHAGGRTAIDAAVLQRRLFDAGLVVERAEGTLLLAPALVMGRVELDEMGSRLRAVLSDCA